MSLYRYGFDRNPFGINRRINFYIISRISAGTRSAIRDDTFLSTLIIHICRGDETLGKIIRDHADAFRACITRDQPHANVFIKSLFRLRARMENTVKKKKLRTPRSKIL